MHGYFIGADGIEESERKHAMEGLDVLLEGMGAVNIRRYELIGRVYAVLTESAAEELAGKGYSIEPENTFRALSQEPSLHPQ